MDIAIRKFLNSHILFREITNDLFIDALVAAMKTRVFVDGAFIIRKGEIGRAMFFNLKGSVEVISDDGTLLIKNRGNGDKCNGGRFILW